jgi:hypothetical protein
MNLKGDEQDAKEIEDMLQRAIDPFGDEEDEGEESKHEEGVEEDFMKLSKKFLHDMRDLNARQDMEAEVVIVAPEVVQE